MSERSEELAEPGRIVAGKYRIDHVLGEGGMGVVVAATHQELDQRAAIKFLPWEVGHVFANQMFAHSVRTPDAPVPWWFWLLFAVSMGGALLYAASLFLGEGTTPYDRLTRTRVRRDG